MYPRTSNCPAMWPMCRYAAALVALCIVLLARAESEAVTHVCIHDRIAALQEKSIRKEGKQAVAEVRSVPMGEHSVGPLGRLYDVFFTRSTAGAGSWAPIRIHISSLDLNDKTKYCSHVGQVVNEYDGTPVTCKDEDVLTPGKRAILLDRLLPEAVALHSERLSVRSITGAIVISKVQDAVCGWFTVPAEHTTTGVRGADYVLYVRAFPIDGARIIAWALRCASAVDGRPLFGVTNISPRYIAYTSNVMRTLAHELLHALGFGYDVFKRRGMVDRADIRGKKDAPLVTSANVLRATKEQYNCDRAPGMELEDKGGYGTTFSHWKRRNAKDELMSGSSGISYYTAITIAAMEDTGFYRGNYAKAEPMSWGQNVGCGLLEKPCLVDGVSQVPSMFCDSNTDQCTSDRLAVGGCSSRTDATMDNCSYVQPYLDAECTVFPLRGIPASLVSPAARCFDGNRLLVRGKGRIRITTFCADVKCGTSTYEVRVSGSSTYVPCPEGKSVEIWRLSSEFLSGNMACPSFSEVCTVNVAGRRRS